MDATSKEISRKTTAKRRFSFKRLCVILLVMAAAGLIISEATGNTQALADFLNPPMHFVEAAYITHEAGAGAQIFATDGGFFLATRDAMRFHNADGAEVFRHSHAMANPVLFGRGSYAAILEQGGRLFHVYNAQGLLYSIPTDAPIVRFALGMQGFAAIMTDGGRGILDIAVYNNFGTMFYYGGHADENIVPLLMDISHDGRVMAISYLDINDAQMNSFISLVSIYGNHAGADGIFAENRHNPGQIIGSMRFLANGSLVALSDTRIFVLNSVAETIWETPLGNRVTHVEFADNWFAVAYGDAMLNRPGHPSGTVIARNSFGIELFAHAPTGNAVRNLQAQGGNLVVGCNQGHLTALSNNGQVLWEKRLAGNVRDVGMLGDSNSLAALSPGQTSVLRRVRNN